MAVLLLQGPLGPFFKHLAQGIEQAGQDVFKINFNGGDASYYSRQGAVNFKQPIEQWPDFLTAFMQTHAISTVIAYGDCRFYHSQAKLVCGQLGVRYLALEEGYLRPNYITLEVGGVNGHSPINHQSVKAYLPVHSVQDEHVMPGNFLKRVRYAMKYYNVAFFSRFHFKHYQHHRSFSPVFEALCWVRAYARKQWYKLSEPSTKALIKSGPFFLVPLQVYNDAQLEFHSEYNSMEEFILEVMQSFAANKVDGQLIFKHHPMDRGHVNYQHFIAVHSKHLGLEQQVRYIHDQHLPSLLKACRGIITINSTTALQAFYHFAPVKVMGGAFFNMQGLTSQNSLADFWHEPMAPDEEFADQFRSYLLDHGQVNGSFYCQFRFTVDNLVAYLQRIEVL